MGGDTYINVAKYYLKKTRLLDSDVLLVLNFITKYQLCFNKQSRLLLMLILLNYIFNLELIMYFVQL